MKKPNVAVQPQEVGNALSATEAALYSQIHDILQQARQQTRRSINQTMAQAYWQVGKLIVKHEHEHEHEQGGQGGQDRAVYGAKTLQGLAQKLSSEFGKGFSAANPRNFRQFYSTYLHP